MLLLKIKLPLDKEATELILDADPEPQAINKYINDCDIFILQDQESCIAILCAQRQGINIEIKNIAVAQKFRRRGYGSEIINKVCQYYCRHAFKTITVGTAAEVPYILEFYSKCGFKKDKIIENFFIDNYNQPVYDGNILCKNMLVFKKDL